MLYLSRRTESTFTSDLGAGKPVHDLTVDMIGERVIPCPKGILVFPSRPHESIEWNSGQGPTGDLRVIVDRKVSLFVFQITPASRCSRSCKLWRRRSVHPRRSRMQIQYVHVVSSKDYTRTHLFHSW